MARNIPKGREYIRLWRAHGSETVELYAARLLSHSYGKHFHEQYTIGINDAGRGTFWCRGAKQLALPKTLNLLAPGEVHTGTAAGRDGWTYRNIYLASSIVQATIRQLRWPGDGLPWFRQCIVKNDRAWLALDRLFWVLSSRHPRLQRDCSLLIGLRLLFAEHGNLSHDQVGMTRNIPAVARARQYLTDRYCDDVSLDELAEVARVSPYYLIRSFQKEVGLSPHAYQLQLRLHRAKEELKSERPLAEIAISHGFFDQSHFHRNFKRAFGATPGQYRKGNSVQD
jgi:AraC-like DNA-binding protein